VRKSEEDFYKNGYKSREIVFGYGNVRLISFIEKFKKGSFYCPFFLIKCYKIIMSKRYSGKSFKDSSVSKKPKLSLKEKRKQKKEKTKKS
jgi:hypothetical protein